MILELQDAPTTFLLRDRLVEQQGDADRPASVRKNAVLRGVDARKQQGTVVRDLLYVLLGYEGMYIRQARSGGYLVDANVDPKFKQSIDTVLVVASQYRETRDFILEFEDIAYGQTMGCLCFQLRRFLNQYTQYVSNITGTVSLLDLVGLLDEYAAQFRKLNLICARISKEKAKREQPGRYNDIQFDHLIESLKQQNTSDLVLPDSTPLSTVKGGIILNIIESQFNDHGFQQNNVLLRNLYEEVSKPYVRMINKWLNYGQVDDPFEEFGLVCQSDEETTFTFRSDGLIFPDTNVQRMILLTGKYKRLAQDQVEQKEAREFIKSFKSKDLLLSLQNAFQEANLVFGKSLIKNYQIDRHIPELINWYLIRGPLNKKFNHVLMEMKKSTIHEQTLAKMKQCFYSPGSMMYQLLEFKIDDISIIGELKNLIDIKAMDANEVLKSQSMSALTSMFKTFNEQQNKQQKTSDGADVSSRAEISQLKLVLNLPSPFNEIISQSQQYELGLLFKFLTLISYLERRYDKSWREIGYSIYWTWDYTDMRVNKLIKKGRLLHLKFFEFLRIYSQYVKSLSVECNLNLTSVEHLDNFKISLNSFLSSSLNDSLLTDKLVSSLIFDMIQLLINFNEFIIQLRKSFVRMDANIKGSVRMENEQWIDSRIELIKERFQMYHQLFSSGYNQLIDELDQMGALDNGKVLFLRDNLAMAFN